MSERARTISIWDPGIVRQAIDRLVPEARSADPDQEPGDVHRRGRQPPHDDRLHPGAGRRHRTAAVHRPGRLLAVVHGAVRQLRRGDGRRPRQGAGRHAAEDADRDRGEPADRRRSDREGAGREPPQGRRRHGARRRVHPGRRRDHRRRRVGGRVGDHRRVGAGHSRVGRRSVRGHRRHARHLGLDQGARHVRSRAHASWIA